LFGEQAALAKQTLNNPFHLVDLTQSDDDMLLGFEWYSLVGIAMKSIGSRDSLRILMEKIAPSLLRIEALGGGEYINLVLQYIVNRCVDFDKQHFEKAVYKSLTKELGETVMTGAEAYFQEGKQEGRQEAKREAAVNLLKAGVDQQTVQQSLDLDKTDIEALLSSSESVHA